MEPAPDPPIPLFSSVFPDTIDAKSMLVPPSSPLHISHLCSFKAMAQVKIVCPFPKPNIGLLCCFVSSHVKSHLINDFCGVVVFVPRFLLSCHIVYLTTG